LSVLLMLFSVSGSVSVVEDLKALVSATNHCHETDHLSI
jgi:hypothetical protein